MQAGQRDASVAGVLGAALLGAAAAAAPVSGSAMGAATAGFLFTLAACVFSHRRCRRYAAATLLLLAGVTLLQVAGLAEGLAPRIWSRGSLLPGPLAATAGGALMAVGLLARDAPSAYSRGVRAGLAVLAGLLAAAGAVQAELLAAAGLAAGVYMLGEMAGWALAARSATATPRGA